MDVNVHLQTPAALLYGRKESPFRNFREDLSLRANLDAVEQRKICVHVWNEKMGVQTAVRRYSNSATYMSVCNKNTVYSAWRVNTIINVVCTGRNNACVKGYRRSTWSVNYRTTQGQWPTSHEHTCTRDKSLFLFKLVKYMLARSNI